MSGKTGIDLKLLEELLKERDRLLKNFPELQILQFEIDELMGKVGDDPFERTLALNRLMINFLKENFIPGLQFLSDLGIDIQSHKVKALRKTLEEASSEASEAEENLQ